MRASSKEVQDVYIYIKEAELDKTLVYFFVSGP